MSNCVGNYSIAKHRNSTDLLAFLSHVDVLSMSWPKSQCNTFGVFWTQLDKIKSFCRKFHFQKRTGADADYLKLLKRFRFCFSFFTFIFSTKIYTENLTHWTTCKCCMKIRGNEPIAALWSIVVQIVVTHLAGRALTSDWSANSFRIVLHENFFLKKSSVRTIYAKHD